VVGTRWRWLFKFKKQVNIGITSTTAADRQHYGIQSDARGSVLRARMNSDERKNTDELGNPNGDRCRFDKGWRKYLVDADALAKNLVPIRSMQRPVMGATARSG
jgi:hypothetical protein